jgi:hypothetical protein
MQASLSMRRERRPMPIAYCIDRGSALEHPVPPCHISKAELVVQKSNARNVMRGARNGIVPWCVAGKTCWSFPLNTSKS